MIDREENDVFTEFTEIDHGWLAAIAATTVNKLRTIRRPMRVEYVELILPAGYTQDAANFYTIELRKGATVIASWSCQTGAQGTIAADTFVSLVLSATDANRVCAPGNVLSLALVKSGSAANLPIGRVVAHCKYV